MHTPPPRRTYLTAREAFQMLGVNSSTGYRLIRQGEFPVAIIRVGNQIRVPTVLMDRLMATGVGAALDAPPVEASAPVDHDGRTTTKEDD